MSFLRFARYSFFLVILFAFTASAEELPGSAQLSADRMRFDSRSGDFLAAGNVLIQTDGLTVSAPRGTGSVTGREVHFAEGVVASGDWQGDWIDLASGSLSLFFAQTPTYIAEGGAVGSVGKIAFDADKFYMKGADISAVKLRRLEDMEAGVAFGAESAYGIMLDGVLKSLTVEEKVWIQGRPNSAGDMVDITGDKAVYSVERGSVVINGNVKAVQKGRTLTSQSLVYFPNENRVEAIGGVTPDNKTGRAQITIDLGQEKQNRGKER